MGVDKAQLGGLGYKHARFILICFCVLNNELFGGRNAPTMDQLVPQADISVTRKVNQPGLEPQPMCLTKLFALVILGASCSQWV